MAEKACHGLGSTTQVGLTQALGLMNFRRASLLVLACVAACAAPEGPSRDVVAAAAEGAISTQHDSQVASPGPSPTENGLPGKLCRLRLSTQDPHSSLSSQVQSDLSRHIADSAKMSMSDNAEYDLELRLIASERSSPKDPAWSQPPSSGVAPAPFRTLYVVLGPNERLFAADTVGCSGSSVQCAERIVAKVAWLCGSR